MRHVLARHEQGAGFAADGYARSTGRPAAAFVISGPGVSNVLTATAQAFSDSVPMLVIASTPDSRSLGQRWGVLHDLNDQQGLMASVLDCATTATTAEAVRDALQRAFVLFHSGRPRPVYLGVPLDVLAMDTDLPAQRFELPRRPLASADDLARASGLLEGARRPLIVAGGGARGAAIVLRQLVEILDAYFVTTAAGKGLLPEAHPANLGCSLPYAPTQRLLVEADVVLAVGTDLTETDLYTADRLTHGGKLIRIDISDREDLRHAAAVSIRADAAPTLESLLTAVTRRSGWRTTAGEARLHRARIESSFD
ncbi:MAG: decarboxylase, partial [Gammaproteobacteria bacterium]|nr:decarboxylase [Gammaproteobacteria bacterium]